MFVILSPVLNAKPFVILNKVKMSTQKPCPQFLVYDWPWLHYVGKEINYCSVDHCCWVPSKSENRLLDIVLFENMSSFISDLIMRTRYFTFIYCKISFRWPKLMREVNGLSLILIDFYVPTLTLRHNSSETSLQLSENITLFASCRVYTGVINKQP
jgi:hypothetical protein